MIKGREWLTQQVSLQNFQHTTSLYFLKTLDVLVTKTRYKMQSIFVFGYPNWKDTFIEG